MKAFYTLGFKWLEYNNSSKRKRRTRGKRIRPDYVNNTNQRKSRLVQIKEPTRTRKQR